MAKYIIPKNQAWVSWSIKTDEFIKENGPINRKKATEHKYFPMDACIKASISMVKQEALALTFGRMANAMMGNG
jgi:hypothetical protein